MKLSFYNTATRLRREDVITYPLWPLPKTNQINDFHLVTWFNDRYLPTCRAVADHARRIQQVNFEYPIILSAAGHVMDGMHRVAKAWMLGMDDINAVQFDHDPEPDDRVPPNV